MYDNFKHIHTNTLLNAKPPRLQAQDMMSGDIKCQGI